MACCAHTAHGPASHGPAFLAELGGVRAGRRPDSDWAVRLSAARDEPERRLLDVSMSMSSLSLEFITSWFEAPFGRSNVSDANEIAGISGEPTPADIGRRPATTSDYRCR